MNRKENMEIKANDIRDHKRTNPFSGFSEMLTKVEATLYDNIKRAEENEDYETMQKALDKFSRLNPSAYMTLLD
jgi:hypothetical protein